MTSHSELDPPVVRPRRQIRLPAHLADYQVSDSTHMKRTSPLNRQRDTAVYAGEVPRDRSVQCEQLTKQMGDFTFSPRPEHPYAEKSRHAPPQRSYTCSGQPVAAVQYDDETPSPRRSRHLNDRDFCLSPCPELAPRVEMQHVHEPIYQGPKPTIPSLTAADPRQFSRLWMALETFCQ